MLVLVGRDKSFLWGFTLLADIAWAFKLFLRRTRKIVGTGLDLGKL